MNLVRQPSRTVVNARINPLVPSSRRLKEPRKVPPSTLSKVKRGKLSVKEKQHDKENNNPNSKQLKKKSHKRNCSVPLLRQYSSAEAHTARNQLLQSQFKSSLLCGQVLRMVQTPTPTVEPSLYSWLQRARCLNQLMKECRQRGLSRHTLYLAISIIDRTCCIRQPSSRKQLQIWCKSSLLLSTKLEQVRPLSILDFSPPLNDYKNFETEISKLLQFRLVVPTLQNQLDELMLIWNKFVEGIMLTQLILSQKSLIRLRMQQLVDLTSLQINSKNHSRRILLNSCLYLAVGYVLDSYLFGESSILQLREGSLFLFQEIATNRLFSTFIGISLQADLQDLLPCLQFVVGFGVLSAEVAGLWEGVGLRVVERRTRLLNQ